MWSRPLSIEILRPQTPLQGFLRRMSPPSPAAYTDQCASMAKPSETTGWVAVATGAV